MNTPSAIPLTFRRRRPQVQSDSGSGSESSDDLIPVKKIPPVKLTSPIKIAKKEINTPTVYNSVITSPPRDLDLSRPMYSSTYNQTSQLFRSLGRFHTSPPALKIPEMAGSIDYLSNKESKIQLAKEIISQEIDFEVKLPEPPKGCFPTFKSNKKPTKKAQEIKSPTKKTEVQFQKVAVKKAIKTMQPVVTDYARELANQNKLYHDKVQQLLVSLQGDQSPSSRIQGMLDLLDNLSFPDFYQKLRTFDHFEMLFKAVVISQDLSEPTMKMGILAFIYFSSKDPIHTEMLLESEFTVPFLLAAMSDYTTKSPDVPSQISNLLNQDHEFKASPSLEAYLAVLSLLQMAEAGSRRLRRLQSLITSLKGLDSVVNCIVENHTTDESLSAAAVEFLSSILQEAGQHMRFQLVKETPSLIRALLVVLDLSSYEEHLHAAAKLLLNITNYHLEAILLVAAQLRSIVNRIVIIHSSGRSLSEKAERIMPFVALLINLTETPELKVLSHIHPMFSGLSLGPPEHLSLLSHLARLFEYYSGIEHHSCWALAGYIGALIAFILKGTHLHSSDLLSLEQICTEVPHGTTFLYKFLEQFKAISVQLESHHLAVHSQPEDAAEAEYYGLLPKTFDESLASLLEHLSKYLSSEIID